MDEKFEKFSIRKKTQSIQKVDFEDARNSKIPVIFDTNFLFVTFEFRIDLIAELEKLLGSDPAFFIYEGTIGELESVEKKKDKNKKFLPLIAKMLEVYDFKMIRSDEKYIDDQILENQDPGVYVATNDKELRKRIKERGGCRIIMMRQKKYLVVV